MSNDLVEVSIDATPANINAVNLSQLKSATLETVNKYKSFPVAEQTEKGAKEIRKELNSLLQSVKRQRIDTEKELLGNWPEVKDQMVELEKIIKDGADLIGDQLKELDETRKENKRQTINKEITKISEAYPLVHEKIVFDERWLNKSYSWPQMLEDINHQFENISERISQAIELEKLRSNEIKNYAEKLNVEADGYIHLLEAMDVEAVKQKMDFDVSAANAAIQAKHEEVERQRQEQQTKVDQATQVGDKLIDSDTGEVVEHQEIKQFANFNFRVSHITAEEFVIIQRGFEKMGIDYSYKEF